MVCVTCASVVMSAEAVLTDDRRPPVVLQAAGEDLGSGGRPGVDQADDGKIGGDVGVLPRHQGLGLGAGPGPGEGV